MLHPEGDLDLELPLDEKGPERTCIVTRAKGSPDGMIRFVVGPDGTVVPDIRAKLPGRGAWVSGQGTAVEAAVKRRAFTRAFKRDVQVDPDLRGQVDGLLTTDALGALALANKAGQVVAGSVKVESALGEGRVIALLHATDGSPDGIRKLDAAARRTHIGGGDPPPRLQIFDSAQMDLALGRANVIHAALLVGGAGAAFLQRALRLELYRKAVLPQRTGQQPEPDMSLS